MPDLKILIKTPKGQAETCIRSQRLTLLGYKNAKEIKEEKVINDRLFYWIISYIDENELSKITERLSKGETYIKNFYKALIKTIDRSNKLGQKLQKGADWLKRRIIKLFKKKYSNSEQSGFIEQVENMTEQEFNDFLIIHDREEMQELLAGDLITIEKLD